MPVVDGGLDRAAVGLFVIRNAGKRSEGLSSCHDVNVEQDPSLCHAPFRMTTPPPSFPRRRKSRRPLHGRAMTRVWIPACAGMTGQDRIILWARQSPDWHPCEENADREIGVPRNQLRRDHAPAAEAWLPQRQELRHGRAHSRKNAPFRHVPIPKTSLPKCVFPPAKLLLYAPGGAVRTAAVSPNTTFCGE